MFFMFIGNYLAGLYIDNCKMKGKSMVFLLKMVSLK